MQVKALAWGSALPLSRLGDVASLLTALLQSPVYYVFPLEQEHDCDLR